jgi:hypothetical protein
MSKILLCFLSIASLCQGHGGAYYLPGVTPHTFESKETVTIIDQQSKTKFYIS